MIKLEQHSTNENETINDNIPRTLLLEYEQNIRNQIITSHADSKST